MINLFKDRDTERIVDPNVKEALDNILTMEEEVNEFNHTNHIISTYGINTESVYSILIITTFYAINDINKKFIEYFESEENANNKISMLIEAEHVMAYKVKQLTTKNILNELIISSNGTLTKEILPTKYLEMFIKHFRFMVTEMLDNLDTKYVEPLVLS